MIDIETMGTAPGAAICAVAAAVFDPYLPCPLDQLPKYSATVDLRSAVEAGLTIEPGTVYWWLEQEDGARRALLEHTRSLHHALAGLTTFIQEHNVVRAWACDPDFDIVLLKHAMDKVRVQWPLHFSAARSLRTLRDLAWPEGERPVFDPGTLHEALSDVLRQVQEVWAAYQVLGLSHEKDHLRRIQAAG